MGEHNSPISAQSFVTYHKIIYNIDYGHNKSKTVYYQLYNNQIIPHPHIEISTKIFTSINHNCLSHRARPHKHTSKCFVIHHIIFKFIEYIDH